MKIMFWAAWLLSLGVIVGGVLAMEDFKDGGMRLLLAYIPALAIVSIGVLVLLVRGLAVTLF